MNKLQMSCLGLMLVGTFLTLSCGGCVSPLNESRAPQQDSAKSSDSRESGRAILPPYYAEEPGYGLYSYLLIGSPPTNDEEGELYGAVIEAYGLLLPEIQKLERYLDRARLNIVYIPLTLEVPSIDSEILQIYDYPRARFFLSKVPGQNLEGPYFISSPKPLSELETLDGGQFLRQDLSDVDPRLAFEWTKLFIKKASEERFWEEDQLVEFKLELRDHIADAARGLEPVGEALKKLIEELDEFRISLEELTSSSSPR